MTGQFTNFPWCVLDTDGSVVDRFETEEEADEYLRTPLCAIGFTTKLIDDKEREEAFNEGMA